MALFRTTTILAAFLSLLTSSVDRAEDPLKLDPKNKDRDGAPLPSCAVARFRTPGLGAQPALYDPVFSPDGKLLAAKGGGQTYVWEIGTGKTIRTFHEPHVSVVFCADGKRLVSVSRSNTLVLWDISTGEQIFKVGADSPNKQGQPDPCLLSPDGRTIVTGNIVWGAKKGAAALGLGHLPPRMLNVPERAICFWEIASGKSRGWAEGHGALAFSPDGRRLARRAGDQSIVLWDLATGQVLRKIKTNDLAVRHVAFAPDGERLVSNGDEDRNEKDKNQIRPIKIWNLSTGTALLQMGVKKETVSFFVAFSPDGKLLATLDDRTFFEGKPYTSGSGQHCRLGPALWDASTGEHLASLFGHTDYVSFSFSPDGKYIATASADNTILLWDVQAAIRAKLNRVENYSCVTRPTQPALPDKKRSAKEPPPTQLTSSEVRRPWADLRHEA